MFKKIMLDDDAEEWRYKNFKKLMLDTYENAKGIEAVIKDGCIDIVLSNLANFNVCTRHDDIFKWYAESSTIRMRYANKALKTVDFDDVWELLKTGMLVYFKELYFNFWKNLKEELGIDQTE